MTPIEFSAYVPCFNNVRTVRRAVESVFAQKLPPREVWVIDDGSMDGSMDRIADMPVRIVRHASNLGRGAARARAMRELPGDLVLCVDATNVLASDFAERGLGWFYDPKVAGVFGRITQDPGRTLAERWRGRHLFKLGQPSAMHRHATFSTFGAIVRATSVHAVGNYSAALRHNEDNELGARLLAAGHDVVYDPTLRVSSIAPDTMAKVLERYWRWNAGDMEALSWSAYRRNIGYAASMARTDARARDFAAVVLSLFSPHYCFWKSWLRRKRNR